MINIITMVVWSLVAATTYATMGLNGRMWKAVGVLLGVAPLAAAVNAAGILVDGMTIEESGYPVMSSVLLVGCSIALLIVVTVASRGRKGRAIKTMVTYYQAITSAALGWQIRRSKIGNVRKTARRHVYARSVSVARETEKR